jgi:hypothetical protein
MIVKKVPTSKTAAPKSQAANVRALVDYIAGPNAGGDGEKVEHRGALNLLNVSHDAQVQEMIDLAEVARRGAQPVQHWILSWREGEQPTPAQADEVVKMLLGEMGLAEHQAVYALHRDTDNWHLHLAVNRVHPETERLVTVNKGFDHEVAHRAIARIEDRQGWAREARGLYRSGPDGAIERVQVGAAGQRQPSARALSFEERTGERSAERVAIGDATPIIRRAHTWRELHDGLAAKGMRYEKKGSGALLWVGEQPAKASSAGRDCSMSALEKRLGPFEPARDGPARELRPPGPLEPSRLWESFAQERRTHYQGRDAARAGLGERQSEEWRRLVERQRAERAEIFRGSWKGKGDLLCAARSIVAARQAQEKADLQERQKLERATLRKEKGRFLSYEEWLREREPDRADQWRHRDRRPATIEGTTLEKPTPRDIRAFSAVVAGRDVQYHRAGERTPAFTDRGKTVDIHDTRRRENVLAALQLSAQKWGAMSVTGGEQFLRTCVELAAERGFKLVNPELQDAIAAERERQQRAKDIERAPDRADDRPSESNGLAGIYRRHFDDILREQPHRGRQDPSRTDAEVAVRMSVTGHSHSDIFRAISDGARAARPSEIRDWTIYAERAADYTASVPGRRLRDQLMAQEQKFLRLESRDGERELLRRLGGPLRSL